MTKIKMKNNQVISKVRSGVLVILQGLSFLKVYLKHKGNELIIDNPLQNNIKCSIILN